MITCDLPHLRDGGSWKAKDGLPKSRMEFYMDMLEDLGMNKIDIDCMMSDLYWDCYEELHAAGKIK
jgi:hypothetical protein